MSRIVIKFGGTSVADVQRIKDAAKKVALEYNGFEHYKTPLLQGDKMKPVMVGKNKAKYNTAGMVYRTSRKLLQKL